MKRATMPLLAVMAALSLVTCRYLPLGLGDDSSPADMADDEITAEMTSLRGRIATEIGDPVCTRPNQCRTIGMGAKPCGGVSQYLIYSTGVTDSVALKNLVGRYNTLSREMNDRHHLISDCMVVLPPDVGCVDGRCGRIEGN